MQRPSISRMLLRGIVRRCPWCGGRGAFFTGWYTKAEHCQSCGLQWRRDDVGFELGAATMTVMMTFGPLMGILGVMVAVSWPEVHVMQMFVVLGVLAVVLPLVAYGPAYVTWQALDIVMRPPTPDDFEIVGDVSSDSDGTSSLDSDHR